VKSAAVLQFHIFKVETELEPIMKLSGAHSDDR